MYCEVLHRLPGLVGCIPFFNYLPLSARKLPHKCKAIHALTEGLGVLQGLALISKACEVHPVEKLSAAVGA